MRKAVKTDWILRVIAFLILLVIIWGITDYILRKPKSNEWDNSGLKYIYENKNYYDVIFAGTSISIANVSNEELYLQYGIAGVTIGEPMQPMYLTYYSLEEALKYQKPKVVLLDVQALFYLEDAIKKNLEDDEHFCLHYSLDNMKSGVTKFRAFCQARNLCPQLDFWDYFSTIYYNHSNWQELGRKNFDRSSDRLIMNGNLILLDVVSSFNNIMKEETDAIAEIPDINLLYFYKIEELCRSEEIPLVLTRGGGIFTQDQYNAVQILADEEGLFYFDLSQYEKKGKINLETDTADWHHFNAVGAQKWTDILGDYLVSNYEFVDRRNDSNYDRYKEQEDFYNSVLKVTNDNIELRSAKDLDGYLEILRGLDFSDTTVFIAVKDEASRNLTYNEIWQMNELGLSAELKDKFRYSYIGIFGEAGIHEFLNREQLYYTGMIGKDNIYAVTSSGWDAGNQASIMINGTEVSQNGRGINIVVYNSILDKVISSVYFDTYQYENPPVSRISNVSQAQYETEPNIWIPLDNYQTGAF